MLGFQLYDFLATFLVAELRKAEHLSTSRQTNAAEASTEKLAGDDRITATWPERTKTVFEWSTEYVSRAKRQVENGCLKQQGSPWIRAPNPLADFLITDEAGLRNHILRPDIFVFAPDMVHRGLHTNADDADQQAQDLADSRGSRSTRRMLSPCCRSA